MLPVSLARRRARSDLRGRNVWITGASSGLGEALAHEFAARGARLLLSARRVDRLERVARDLGSADVRVLPLDLAEVGALPARAKDALTHLGRVDVMVHNAGVGQRAAVTESTLEVDRKLLDVNFLGPVALTKALLPAMLATGSGTFVVVSSVLGLLSMKRRAAYCASKHALHGYFNALRAELHGQGVRVLMVCPGHIDSEFSRHALAGDGRPHGVDESGQRSGISPVACARQTLRALERGTDEIYPGSWESLGVYLNRLAPGLVRRALASAKAR